MDENVGCGQEMPDAEEVLEALDALLSSRDLHLSERNRRFLSFVVTQAVKGQAGRIKAYAIGVDVFGRDEGFDPGTDPIVRIEATRLRAALASYYEGIGAQAGIRISLPKGSYVPAFARAIGSSPPKAVKPPAWCHADTVPVAAQLILQDHSRRGDESVAARAEFFLDALAVTLRQAAFTIRVVPSHERKAAAEAIRAIYSAPHAAFSLDVAVRPVGGTMRYSWRLGDLETGEILAASFRDYLVASGVCYERIDDLAAEATDVIATAVGRGRLARSSSAS